MSGTIILARHATHAEVGQVLSGRSEISLSEAGRAEAARLSEHLARLPIAAVHSSPRRRARETAEAVAAPRGLPVEQAEALDEIDFGVWSGRSFDALADDPAWRAWNVQRGSAATAAGATMAASTARALDYLRAIRCDAPVLCVTHCDIIRGVVAHALKLDYDCMLRFDCDPASLTILRLGGDDAHVVTLNERPR